MELHDSEELDNDLRGRAEEDLTLAPALGIEKVVLVRLQIVKSFMFQLPIVIDFYSQGSRSK